MLIVYGFFQKHSELQKNMIIFNKIIKSILILDYAFFFLSDNYGYFETSISSNFYLYNYHLHF
jgi:hypothetical protein